MHVFYSTWKAQRRIVMIPHLRTTDDRDFDSFNRNGEISLAKHLVGKLTIFFVCMSSVTRVFVCNDNEKTRTVAAWFAQHDDSPLLVVAWCVLCGMVWCGSMVTMNGETKTEVGDERG